MAYFTQTDLTALIPPSWLTEGLDDDDNGTQDAFTVVQQLAEDEVNGELGRHYPVPFDTTGNEGLTSYLRSLCVYIAAEIVYERRGQELHKSWADKLAVMRARLARIGNGEEKLNPEAKPNQDTMAVISAPADSYSTNLAH